MSLYSIQFNNQLQFLIDIGEFNTFINIVIWNLNLGGIVQRFYLMYQYIVHNNDLCLYVQFNKQLQFLIEIGESNTFLNIIIWNLNLGGGTEQRFYLIHQYIVHKIIYVSIFNSINIAISHRDRGI